MPTTDADIVIVLNLLFTLIVGWGLLWLNGTVWQQTKFNKYRFRLFELRDQLTLLVMKGQIKEGSPEHRVLLRLLTGAIKSTGTFEVTHFLRFIAQWVDDSEGQREFAQVLDDMKTHPHPEYREIVQGTLELARHMIGKDTWLLFNVLYPLLKMLDWILRSPAFIQHLIAKIARLFAAKLSVASRLDALRATA
ncbi:MAG: hypothetical protein HQL79_09275 [Magnetococcales bacterium]|nr:hypothetical protein [Magnetococcales bacterium]